MEVSMKFNTRTCAMIISLIFSTVIPMRVAAQSSKISNKPPRYKLIDLGTFGGNESFVPAGPPFFQLLNERGTVVGFADTTTPDPFVPYCITDCLVAHAFKWTDGVKSDLGALPGANNSVPLWINSEGAIAGVSESGLLDPLTGFPEFEAVLWKNGKIQDLGNLGGGGSLTEGMNDSEQVVGGALNSTLDSYASNQPFSVFPVAQQYHAFLWERGTMHDLGTLGGGDSVAAMINDSGQVAGVSYTNTTPNPATGVPTLHPFFWEEGRMEDMGTLGGTFGYPNWINRQGQVIGQSNLAGDQTYHPFLWANGKMKDLGTFGGPSGSANWVNDNGEVVGYADFPGGPCTGLGCTHHGFLWKRGALVDLGTLGTDPCSRAYSIDLAGQVVGESAPVCGGEVTEAFLWQNGAIYDLNTLIPAGSSLHLTEAFDINDHGEITGNGILTNGDVHAFLLIPCDDACDKVESVSATAHQSTTASVNAKVSSPSSTGRSSARGDGRFGNYPSVLSPTARRRD
jgi:probable HAF family extracellular repeat protein